MEIEDIQNKSKEHKMVVTSPEIKEVKKEEDKSNICCIPGTPILKLELINSISYAYNFSYSL